MIAHIKLFAVGIIFCICLSACAFNIPGVTKNDPEPAAQALPVNVIALLPVENKTADARTLEMLRSKLGEELRFKGYPQIATDLVDSRLSTLAEGKEKGKNDAIAPQAIKDLLGADGAMYCSLKENATSKHPFYTPVTVTVRCELRSTQTGELLWSAQSRGTSRSFDIVRSRLKMKSQGDLETALEEAVGEVLETLPYGPHLRG